MIPALLLLLAVPAHARDPRPLREEWQAAPLTTPAVVLATTPVPVVAALDRDTGGLVAFDARTGAITWRAAPPAGVTWGTLSLGEEGLGAEGTPEAPGFSLLDPAKGTVRWSVAATPEEHLRVGPDGGVVALGPCDLTVLDPRTGARGEKVAGRAGEACVPPQLLGAVGGEAILLAPVERGAGWRLFRTDGARHPWYVELGDLVGEAGFDWDTSTLWVATNDGLRMQRRNLGSGVLAWDSAFAEAGCAATARPASGPMGVPSILADLCSRLVLVDPHSGREVWQVPTQAGEPVLVRGAVAGWVAAEAGADVLPYGESLLIRAADAVSLVGAGGTTWTLPGATTGWALVSDLLVRSPASGPALVTAVATGEVIGTLPTGQAPLVVVALPGSNTRRLLLTVGDGIHAWQVPGR